MVRRVSRLWRSLGKTLQHSWIGAGINAVLSLNAFGQDAQVEEVLVVGDNNPPYRINGLSQTKYTESQLNTPQSITTLTNDLLDDRSAMSLNDALRNVPGITLGAGEFSWQGNNPSLRGFSSRNDMFMDGMRDFGSYYRDPFNLESIEVLQGPSSVMFGRGSTGGVINQVNKAPVPDPLRRLSINAGNADTLRLSADLNQPVSIFGKSGAVRLNLLDHDGGVPGRNGASSERIGFAPSVSMNLDDLSTLTVSYLRQTGDSVPDYGLPWISGRPADVPRETYYGFTDDFIDTTAEVTTVKYDRQLNESMRLNFQTRHAEYSRDSRITEPQLENDDADSIRRFVFRGNSVERMLQGQFNLISTFATGTLRHTLVAGIESGDEFSSPSFGFGEGVPDTRLIHPEVTQFSGTTPTQLDADTNAHSAAVYFLDTIQLDESWQLMAGVRRDRFSTHYRENRFETDGTLSARNEIKSKDIENSYRLAVIYKPLENGTAYLGLGTSFNPSTEGLSQISSGRNLTISNVNLKPEENRSIELGTKWEFASGRLLVDAALFRIEKTNARVPDPNNPGFNLLAGEQQVVGFSLNLSGNLTRQIQVTGGYTYLDSEQQKTSQLNVVEGSPLQNVAENNFSLWLNYQSSFGAQIGMGARFVDDRLATITSPTKSVADYWNFDLMAKYEFSENISVKMNLTNLSDEYYFDQLHPWHVVPGPGFASVFALNLEY